MAGKNLDNNTRKRIVELYMQGEKTENIAEYFMVSSMTIYRIIKNYKITGNYESGKKGGQRKRKFSLEAKEHVEMLIEENCSITLQNIKNSLNENFSINCSTSTIHNNLANFLYSFKKVSVQPEGRNTENLIGLRREYAIRWLDIVASQDGNNVLFLDEVGFSISLRSRYGRSLKGKAAIQRVRSIRSKNFSVCCAISKDKIIYFERQDKAFTTETFNSFIYNLISKLRNENMNNMIITMDNVAFHKSPIIASTLRAAGHSINFLPAYSPFLNPIENMFSKVKTLVRRRVQNQQELFASIEESFGEIVEEDCRGYYRHMLSFIPRCLNNELIEDEN